MNLVATINLHNHTLTVTQSDCSIDAQTPQAFANLLFNHVAGLDTKGTPVSCSLHDADREETIRPGSVGYALASVRQMQYRKAIEARQAAERYLHEVSTEHAKATERYRRACERCEEAAEANTDKAQITDLTFARIAYAARGN